jgi:polysaccharide biosynthesis/export protein
MVMQKFSIFCVRASDKTCSLFKNVLIYLVKLLSFFKQQRKDMKKTLLSKLLYVFLATILGVSINVFAQPATPNPTVKKNSPFTPNPKKKAENNTQTTESTTEKIVQIEPSNQVDETSVKANSETISDENKTEIAALSSANRTRKVVEESSKPFVATEVYQIGIGDVLDIKILNAKAKESTLFTVLEGGFIDYPLAGNEPIQVTGLTTEQIEQILRENIKLFENPEVVVKVRDYQSHLIDVIGLVEKPGKKALRREAIPLFAIKVDAIVQSKANQLIVRRGDQVEKLNLKDSATDNFLVKTGDILEFTYIDQESAIVSNQPQFYYTKGNGLISGGEKPFRAGITLLQAIAASGGLKKEKTKKVTILRKDEKGLFTKIEVNLQEIVNGQKVDINIQAGDIIEVAN